MYDWSVNIQTVAGPVTSIVFFLLSNVELLFGYPHSSKYLQERY